MIGRFLETHPRLGAALAAAMLVQAMAMVAPLTASAQVFEPETFTLDNGLEVVVVSNRRAPIVTHMVWYKVGAADEPEGKSGIAHFLEHLMFKGTKTLEPGEFSRIVALNGSGMRRRQPRGSPPCPSASITGCPKRPMASPLPLRA